MKELTIKDIQTLICDKMGISQQNLVSKSRDRQLVIIRQVSIYFCSKLTHASTTTIGRSHNRDHSTVIYSCKTVENMIRIRDKYTWPLYLRLKDYFEMPEKKMPEKKTVYKLQFPPAFRHDRLKALIRNRVPLNIREQILEKEYLTA